MSLRTCFRFAAAVALVLSVAALPSLATERRDLPLALQDAQQSASVAKNAHVGHAQGLKRKRASQAVQPSNSSVEKSAQQGPLSPFEAKDQVRSESSSGSSKSARTSAGK